VPLSAPLLTALIVNVDSAATRLMARGELHAASGRSLGRARLRAPRNSAPLAVCRRSKPGFALNCCTIAR
jgi:hypothetical protein